VDLYLGCGDFWKYVEAARITQCVETREGLPPPQLWVSVPPENLSSPSPPPYMDMRMVMMPKKSDAGAYPEDEASHSHLHLCGRGIHSVYGAFKAEEGRC
jgi:hypothetical protein